ncbi:hypothetical protein [Flavobacterium quisquiliarum]|uniref:Uncharacterized protein n=1 Tax=Flavobacterium quisquiliarum TaxID=1834436 RepID=A0ABV8W323_9FLAO|nr:hypothetical protein [Flavobacterium quisquiliarum]MBW1654322.1 hypothetical protein [Flavobacterium quisquiliarum]NWL03365.1 hypothetical protein [Flavobacterium collinsii]
MKTKSFLFLIVLITGISCKLTNDSPDQIFNTIGLNANKIPSSFERVFKEFRQHKANGTLQLPTEDGKSMKKATCVEVVKFAYANTFKEDIRRIKNLNSTEEAEPIIKAGIELFEYADEIQNKDFMMIARMIDEGKSDEEIDAAAKELDETKGMKLEEKYTKVMDLLLPYADANGVEYNKY